MSPLVLVLAACVTPADQTPGWKAFPLEQAPALAAAPELEQFRAGEKARIADRSPGLLVAEHPEGLSTRYTIAAGDGAQAFTLEFATSLRGAQVDVEAEAGLARFRLSTSRVNGSLVNGRWNVPGVRRVDVVVHHHLRGRPAVAALEVERLAVVAAPGASPGTLYVHHPGGVRLELCDAPGRVLSVRLPLEGWVSSR